MNSSEAVPLAKWVIPVLRVVIVLALAGSLVVQTVLAPLIWADLNGNPLWARIAMVSFVVLGVATTQVFAVCVWMLLNRVAHGTIFGLESLRPVEVIIGALLAGAALTWALAAVLAPGAEAPGAVALIGGLGLVLAGLALMVVVGKGVLRQAIARDAERRALLRGDLTPGEVHPGWVLVAESSPGRSSPEVGDPSEVGQIPPHSPASACSPTFVRARRHEPAMRTQPAPPTPAAT